MTIYLKTKLLIYSGSDIENFHRLGKTNPKYTIVRFVNRKFCNDALEQKKN